MNLRKFWDAEESKLYGVKNHLNLKGSVLLLIGGCLLLLSILILISKTGLDRSTLIFELVFFLPFSIYLMIIISTKHFKLDTKQYFLPVVVLFAFLIQIIVLTTEITLSDDLYRYFLEGKMFLNGLNPYLTSLDNVPSNFTSEFLPLVNNSHITSPYPPLAILLFAILSWIWEDPLLFRIVFSISFILSIVSLDKLLLVKHRWKLVVFAWNPLFHLETGNGSHFEALIVLLIIFALLNLEQNRRGLASITLLATFFLKYYSIFLIPLFWKRLGKNGQRIFSIGMLGYVTWIFLNPSLITGLLTFAGEWYFNASTIWVLFELTSSFFLAKLIAGSIFIIILIVILFKAQKYENIPYMYAGVIIGLFLLLQPTFHPWYLFWLFPFILLEKDTIPWSWIILSGLIIFSYNVYIQFDTVNVWNELILVRIIEYVPFYSLFLYENRMDIFTQIKILKSYLNKRRGIFPS
ncbi:hypothetical protein CEE45_16750 [Candidatus Heimdallarchaeota archaeon B3_Heim]|nr:MAG: hypothetical protein CEE45_16750 [Candidatus Heimdallarchaeota archaeon B3_Heim]